VGVQLPPRAHPKKTSQELRQKSQELFNNFLMTRMIVLGPMKNVLRERAQELRKKGLSYKEIKEKISVSKSTLSLWLRDVPLAPEQKKRLYTKQIEILSRGPMSQRIRRTREIDAIIKKALHEIGLPLSRDTFKLFGTALYWAEGNKTRNFGITNSDPYLIMFMVQWLKEIFHVDPKTLRPHLNIYSQQDEITLKKFWSEITGIPLVNFGKSFIKPANKGFKKNNLYYGTIKIYVPKGTDLMHVVYGWRKAVLQNLENKVDSIERRWVSLKQTGRPINLD
jgi:transcriptional regulator with XRE-family HTH domain